jgi:hypothetical protein
MVSGGRILCSRRAFVATTFTVTAFTDMKITLLNSADSPAGARQDFMAEDLGARLPVEAFMVEEGVTEAAAAEVTDNQPVWERHEYKVRTIQNLLQAGVGNGTFVPYMHCTG